MSCIGGMSERHSIDSRLGIQRSGDRIAAIEDAITARSYYSSIIGLKSISAKMPADEDINEMSAIKLRYATISMQQ